MNRFPFSVSGYFQISTLSRAASFVAEKISPRGTAVI
jgi:hypothetical protein